MNPITIRQTLLRLLAYSKPHPLPAETLLSEVNRLVRPALTAEELHTHLSWLLDRSLVGFMPDELAPDSFEETKWFIKEAGLTALQT